MHTSIRFATAALAVAIALSGCATGSNAVDRIAVYHCVGGAVPVPPPDTWGRRYLTEKFEYGAYRVDETTIAKGIFGHTRCGEFPVPGSAYLRYRVDGAVVEKRFDLSALNSERVKGKTVEFFVDGMDVQVRLVTSVPGTFAHREVIVSQ